MGMSPVLLEKLKKKKKRGYFLIWWRGQKCFNDVILYPGIQWISYKWTRRCSVSWGWPRSLHDDCMLTSWDVICQCPTLPHICIVRNKAFSVMMHLHQALQKKTYMYHYLEFRLFWSPGFDVNSETLSFLRLGYIKDQNFGQSDCFGGLVFYRHIVLLLLFSEVENLPN